MEQMRNEINELIEQSKQKAKVLTEALPYIRRFNNCYVVVKYGGSAMKDKNLQKSVIRDVALLKLVGMKPIIVHGGGKEISKWVRMSGKEPEFYHGLRVTDKETMEVAEMVLFKVNQELVAMISRPSASVIVFRTALYNFFSSMIFFTSKCMFQITNGAAKRNFGQPHFSASGTIYGD